jgi:hypothetical protein
MLNFKDEQSVINELDQSDVDSARRMLDEIGSRFSDVFGTDAVIWVEGPTEEECFPLLVKAAEIQMPAGMVIARLRGTGDLEGKRAKACADIYRNLSAAGSILPHNVTITLDGDKTKNPYVATLEEVFETKVRFLPRQMYECYLLHPPAVAALLNSLPSFKNAPISQSRVEEWISAKGQDAKYRAQSHKILSDEWLSAVDAARLLVDLVQSLSDAKENYSKTSHSVWLTRWLIANDKDFLQELIDYVSGLVKVAGLPSEASPQ